MAELKMESNLTIGAEPEPSSAAPEPEVTPEPKPGPMPSATTVAPEEDGELINKVVPIVTAVAIVIIILLIYFCCYKKKKCTHQETERGDSPGDIGYYHNKGYNTDDKPPPAENGKKGISWVNERNGVETIPYNLPPEPDKNSNIDAPPPTNTSEPGEAEQQKEAEPQASTSSRLPAGYVPCAEEDRQRAYDIYQ